MDSRLRANDEGWGTAPARLLQGAGLAATLLLAACGVSDRPSGSSASAPPQRPRGPVSDAVVKIGKPYQVAGVWYSPVDDRTYDEVGLASWYGPRFHGLSTANGEYFDANWIGAAHKTLPLPSYVEVTALDTGRTILVRVNDRGPFVSDRIIDLSRGAADLLGMANRGVVKVRVRRVEPSEADKLALRSGKPASRRPDASPTMLANLRARLPQAIVQPPRQGDFIQVGAFSDRLRAEALSASLSDIGQRQIIPTGPLWRVRIGPFADATQAQAVLAQVQQRGYQEARLIRDFAAF